MPPGKRRWAVRLWGFRFGLGGWDAFKVVDRHSDREQWGNKHNGVGLVAGLGSLWWGGVSAAAAADVVLVLVVFPVRILVVVFGGPALPPYTLGSSDSHPHRHPCPSRIRLFPEWNCLPKAGASQLHGHAQVAAISLFDD